MYRRTRKNGGVTQKLYRIPTMKWLQDFKEKYFPYPPFADIDLYLLFHAFIIKGSEDQVSAEAQEIILASTDNLNNEKLEFMGDRVFELIVTDIIYSISEIKTPHEMSLMAINLTKNLTMKCYGEGLGLCTSFIKRTNFYYKKCADIFEALMAVMYLHLKGVNYTKKYQVNHPHRGEKQIYELASSDLATDLHNDIIWHLKQWVDWAIKLTPMIQADLSGKSQDTFPFGHCYALKTPRQQENDSETAGEGNSGESLDDTGDTEEGNHEDSPPSELTLSQRRNIVEGDLRSTNWKSGTLKPRSEDIFNREPATRFIQILKQRNYYNPTQDSN